MPKFQDDRVKVFKGKKLNIGIVVNRFFTTKMLPLIMYLLFGIFAEKIMAFLLQSSYSFDLASRYFSYSLSTNPPLKDDYLIL